MLLHLGLNVITFRSLLHLGPNVITFRTLLHLGLQQTYSWNLNYFISFQLNLEPVTMEQKRFIWLDREHKWMEIMDFHISSNKSVKELFVKMYTRN